jgi:rhodanese-related sulfurtransferase
VSDSLLTSDPSIYAVGDVIEITDLVSGDKAMVPLAGPANKQGRIAADNIAGLDERYRGTQGTSVARVFDLTAASTGANEKTLQKRGLARGRDYETVTISQNSHAGYYPGAAPMILKLIFSPDGKKLFGAQIVGRDGVDKRIDTIAATLAWAAASRRSRSWSSPMRRPTPRPRTPSTWRALRAQNVIRASSASQVGRARQGPGRGAARRARGRGADGLHAAGAVAHRRSASCAAGSPSLTPSKTIIVFCAIGVRAYNAARILMQNGFENVLVYPGGTRFYQSTHYTPGGELDATPVLDSGSPEPAEKPARHAPRLQRPAVPRPHHEGLRDDEEMKDGRCWRSRPPTPASRATSRLVPPHGQHAVSNEKRRRRLCGPGAQGRRGRRPPSCATRRRARRSSSSPAISTRCSRASSSPTARPPWAGPSRCSSPSGAHGAAQVQKAAREKDVHGIHVRRDAAARQRQAQALAHEHGRHGHRHDEENHAGQERRLPRGPHPKGHEAQGVKIVACTMSMDVMGIKEEELIEGVELGGVGAYLGDAEESNVNLFI